MSNKVFFAVNELQNNLQTSYIFIRCFYLIQKYKLDFTNHFN